MRVKLVKVTQLGQVSVPAQVRRRLAIGDGDYLEVAIEGNRIVMAPKARNVRLVKVTDIGQVSVPVQLRQALNIKKGDYLEVTIEGNRVVMTPKAFTDRLPPVALSQRGEQMLEEGLDDVRAGKVRKHDSVASLIHELHDEADQD
jgi:AbrB family looped-hinge helix DNA binding protein